MKDSVQRRAWSDIRRGVFTPEPLTEHWVEVTEDSELMCDVCKSFHQNDSRMGTCTENRTRCLNCASNWTRSAIYGTEAVEMDEFSQDARVAARLLNIYNECVDWRNMEAEKDLLDHGNTCNALRIQNDQRRAQAGVTSRCHPHARIHGEGKMQASPVAPIHCAT